MIITATEIDNNKKQIQKIVDEEVIKYVKQRLAKEVRELKLRMQIDNKDWKLSAEIKNELKQRIINDQETQAYKAYQIQLQQQKSENYFIVRDTLNNLNELNEFSAEIERMQLQTIDKFNTFENLLKLSNSYSLRFDKYKELRQSNIHQYITTYHNKRLSFESNPENIIKSLNELYLVTKDIDDIDLFDKFDMQTNIDLSNKLGDIYLHAYTNHQTNQDNIINIWASENYSNIPNIVSKLSKRKIISNQLFGILLLSNSGTGRTSFVTNNSVTCYKTMYTTTDNNKYTYTTRTLGELLMEIVNPKNSTLTKSERQQIYNTYDGTRPKSNEYYKWNGLQVFDIDLKEWNQVSTHIDLLKQKMYEYLTDFHWFLWIAKSASGKGLHIYTKVSPPHHIYSDVSDNEYISKYWYKVNYAHKSSIVYDILKHIHDDYNNTIRFSEDDFIDNFELRFLDNIVSRITAGIRLTFDNQVLINPNFIDFHPGIGISKTLSGYDDMQILFRHTKNHQKIVDEINTDLVVDSIDDFKQRNIDNQIDLTKYEFSGELTKIQPLPKNSINYNIRYNVVNTLASLFGKDGLPIAHTLLQSEACNNVREINSFYSCALSNHKEPSKLGIDLLKKSGIIKQVKKDVKVYTDNIFKNGIRKLIERSTENKIIKPNIELQPNEYLGDKRDILLDPLNGGFTNEKINILLSPAGSGKTRFLLDMAESGKRILLVEPFISVIKNKVETDVELMRIFDVFYGEKRLDKLEPGVNAITTFDKFSISNYEKISRMFDYICIDESHLLFTSSYRIEATSNAVRKIKELFYISSNDPFAAKIILMTGTETGDVYFFGDISNVIRVSKKMLDKEMEFLICNDSLDAVTRLAYKAYQMLSKNYRLLIPTNKGEIYSHKLIGMIEYLMERPVKYGYYKRSNVEQEICRLINDSNTVGDYEIIFCSNYLSVGVDIVDRCKFASIYWGNWSGYEIEQFNARIRKTGIKSIYCIQTETNDGTTNDLLIEEPNLSLKLTDDDINNFVDDKSIAKAKQEFIAQYDPILHKITTPGFSYINGAIRFNKEEYELTTFENKYLEAMSHPVKVARELSKYGYKIEVSPEYDGLSLEIQETLKKIGIESAREEKVRKHSLLVGTYLALIENNQYTSPEGLEFNDVIGFIGKHRELIFEDREMEEFIKIEYNVFAQPVQIYVKSKEALDFMYGPAKYLIQKYSITKAKEIILQYVDETGILKQKNFKRAMNLLRLIDRADANDLSEPVFKTIEKIYDWLDKFSINRSRRISYNEYQSQLDLWTNEYIGLLNITINTQYGFDKIRDSILEMLCDLGTKNTSKDGIRFEYNRLPDADSTIVKHKRSIDSMVENLFKITSEVVLENKRVRKNHIILEKQEF